MARPKKTISRNSEYAQAADALRDLNFLDNAAAAPARPKLPLRSRRTLGASLALDRERRPEAIITLAPVTMGAVTDSDIGLPDDPVAQLQAETYLRAVIAYRMREEERARQLARAAALAVPANVPVVHVEIADESILLVAPTDRLSPEDAVILRELRRLAGRHQVNDRSPAVS